ncbi:MAG: dephospho-CoA kinase [Prevotella sp.]|nr:dephospho-CoA kinase [Prevotella sp.]
MQKTTFNEAQLELLRMMSLIDTPEAVSDLRQALSDYFAKKAKEEIDGLWEKGELTEEKVESFRHLHERTPYQANNGR